MPDTTTIEAAAPTPARRRSPLRRIMRFVWRSALFTLGPMAVVLVGVWIYLSGGRHITTENAYVKADTVTVSTDIDGRVAILNVTEHQLVRQGDVLFELDPRPFRIALANAQARVDVARAEVESLRRTWRRRREELALAREDLEFARREYGRQQRLSENGVVARAQFDDALRKMRLAEKTLPALSQAIEETLARLGGDPDVPAEQHPAFVQAVTDRDKAMLDLDYTRVRSPVDGVVSHLSLQPGEYLEAGDAAFGIVSGNEIYVTANLKETQLTNVSVGQSARIRVDAYPGREWSATVTSISPATGAEFSVLPAQNASGNWVKVVQRLPVRLAIGDALDSRASTTAAPEVERSRAPVQFRAGMSVEVSIDTGYERPVPPALRARHAAMKRWMAEQLEMMAGWLSFDAYAIDGGTAAPTKD